VGSTGGRDKTTEENVKVGMTDGCAVFAPISPNISEETLNHIPDVGDEAVCESQLFTEKGMTKVMSDSIEYLKKGELYETANEVYKLLIRLYETNHDYHSLARCHGDLEGIFKSIITANENQGRLLGSYYRVVFHGKGFEELDGKEFVYKEPKITRYQEISERLLKLYSGRLGGAKVKLWQSPKDIDPSRLESGTCCIHITSVEPYFPKSEQLLRITYYERHNNIRQFIFETPITSEGPGQAKHVRDQGKRKTILTTKNYFPYVKKRIKIIKKEVIEMRPIENSIEDIEARTAELRAELQTQPPNPKTLQHVLQGSVRPQIHAGPGEIAKTFIGETEKYDKELVAMLRQTLSQFLLACDRALELNARIIDSHQLPFHEELLKGFHLLSIEMNPYLFPEKQL